MDATINTGAARGRVDLSVWLGVTIGILMPLVSALLYPVYMHQMQPAWAEWTRLLELPFVVCELVIIHLGMRQGYDDRAIWRELPRDARGALGVLLIGLVASSVLVSKNPAASVTISLITLIHLRFAAAIYFVARATRPDVTALFRWLALGLLALAALTIGKFALPPPDSLVPGGRIEWASALPGFISVRHFGSWSGAIAAGLAVALLYGGSNRMTAAAYALAFGLTCWSGTRAAVLAIGVVIVVAVIAMRRLPGRRAVLLVATLSLVALAAAMALVPAGEPRVRPVRLDSITDANAAGSGRVELWDHALHRWLDAPWFGWGSGSTFWEVKIAIGWTHTQPHNVILQFLISWGIVGAAGGLWLLGRAIRAVHATGFRDEALRPLTATLYALLFMSLLEGMLHYPRFIMLIMVGFATILAKKHAAA